MKLKKLLSALTVLSIIFSSAAMCSAADENKVTDNFENYPEFANEGAWNTKNPIVTETDGNKCAVFGAGTTLSSLYAQVPGFSSDVTGLIANFSIKFEGDVKQHIIFGAAGSNVPAAGAYRVMQFYCGGSKLQICVDGKYDMPFSYTTGKWYDVSVRLRYSDGYYELNVSDGENVKQWVKTNTTLARPTADNKAALKYFVFWIDKIANQTVYIDNVNIYGVTGERIYPTHSELCSFEAFSASDSQAVPSGFTTDSTLEDDNGFGASEGALNFKSVSGKLLAPTKVLSEQITPPNVTLKLSDASSADFTLKLEDESGNIEEVFLSPENIAVGDKTADYHISGDEIISVTSKDGALKVFVSGEDSLAVIEKESSLAGLKAYSLISSENADTDITIEKINFATSTYFEKLSSSAETERVLPNTNIVTIDFSNTLANGSSGIFEIDGDVSVADVICSGKSVSLVLDANFSPLSSYTIRYADVYDIEGCALSGEITFATAPAVEADSFEISDSGDSYAITTALCSNTGSAQNAVLILTAYDNSTGKIVSVDFENITITETQQTFSASVSKPSLANYSVEAYLWDSFENANTLGFFASVGGEQQ